MSDVEKNPSGLYPLIIHRDCRMQGNDLCAGQIAGGTLDECVALVHQGAATWYKPEESGANEALEARVLADAKAEAANQAAAKAMAEKQAAPAPKEDAVEAPSAASGSPPSPLVADSSAAKLEPAVALGVSKRKKG